MGKVIIQNLRREDLVKAPIQVKQKENKNIVIENKRRPVFVRQTDPGLINKVRNYISDPNREYYLGFGGTGDALLLLACCYNNPHAKVIFFSNNLYFMGKFFDLFKVSVLLHENIMGRKIAEPIFNMVTKHPKFRSSAHLADGLNYGDWVNTNKYESRIVASVPWIENLGTIERKQPILIIAPSGSTKEQGRQRYLNKDEYNKLVEVNRHSYKIYSVGSLSDLHYYGFNHNSIWLTADRMYTSNNESKDLNLHQMLQIINTASKVISMDTWLKTYTLLCGIPTIIVKTRWNGKYMDYGADVTDFVFLNKNIWPSLTMNTIEELF